MVDGRPVGLIQTYLAADHLDWEQIVQVSGVCPGRSADRRGRADRPRLGPRILVAFVDEVVFARWRLREGGEPIDDSEMVAGGVATCPTLP